VRTRASIAALAAVLLLAGVSQAARAPQGATVPLDVHEFRVLGERYDPENPRPPDPTYYQTIDAPRESFIRAVYVPPRDTVTLFHAIPDGLRRGVRAIRWRWRVHVLPPNGNECIGGRGDSAAAVYVTWKRGLRWYSVKFVWSSEAPLGATCNKIRNPLTAADSVVLRTGAPGDGWVEESVDPDALFREHFEGGNPAAGVPELQGIGLMSDGDQTDSISAADYADFALERR